MSTIDWSLDTPTLRKKLLQLSKAKLIKECKLKNVSHIGNKKDIIERLLDKNRLPTKHHKKKSNRKSVSKKPVKISNKSVISTQSTNKSIKDSDMSNHNKINKSSSNDYRKKLQQLTKPKLIRECKLKKVSHNGTKREIIERLIDKYEAKQKRKTENQHNEEALNNQEEKKETVELKIIEAPKTDNPNKVRQKRFQCSFSVSTFANWKAECFAYFVFLIIFTAMIVLSKGIGDMNYIQTIAIRNPLINNDKFVPNNAVGEKTFGAISQIDDIYNYLKEVAIPFLLNNGYVQSQQHLLGGLRLKQVRLKETECDYDRCWSESDYDKTDIYFGKQQFRYMDSSEIMDQSWRGKYGSYPGGGYIWDFSMSYNSVLIDIDYLYNISFIDGGTKFVCLDFNTFNPSTSLHTISRLSFEMNSGVSTMYEIKTWKLDRYSGIDGDILLVLQVLFVICVVWITIVTIYDMCKYDVCKCNDKSFWHSNWKIIDILNLIIFYISIILSVVIIFETNELNMFSKNVYVSFRRIQYWFIMETYSNAINSILLWIKVFKYLSINKRLNFLFKMMRYGSRDICMFMIVLLIFIIAFGTAAFITFSGDIDDFRSYIFAMSNMVRFTLVEMDYIKLTLSSNIWGAIFWYLWSLCTILVLMNVIIAIIIDSYSNVQFELSQDDDDNTASDDGEYDNKTKDIEIEDITALLRNVLRQTRSIESTQYLD